MPDLCMTSGYDVGATLHLAIALSLGGTNFWEGGVVEYVSLEGCTPRICKLTLDRWVKRVPTRDVARILCDVMSVPGVGLVCSVRTLICPSQQLWELL
ncbi:hypothetical protein DSO57_1033430 [Entomophthora muscae]|uniref:Uncharacterized protein n=1 Tax=Entomophthora muscae TaxID=34485 RepID=A0ACC2UAW6_9FUNG|nr:hypothetical protein DSO57_1033430 [Entomophthora muscae]